MCSRRLFKRKRVPSLLAIERMNYNIPKQINYRTIKVSKKTKYNPKNTKSDTVDYKQLLNCKLFSFVKAKLVQPKFGKNAKNKKRIENIHGVYLEGSNGLTTKCLIAEDFAIENFIAVSNDPNCVTQLKDMSFNIKGKGIKKKVNVILADFETFADNEKLSNDIVYVDGCSTWDKIKKHVYAGLKICGDNAIFAFSCCRRDPLKKGSDFKFINNEIKKHFNNIPYEKDFKISFLDDMCTGGSPSYCVYFYHIQPE